MRIAKLLAPSGCNPLAFAGPLPSQFCARCCTDCKNAGASLALCCFTPVLVILLGVVGLSALTGYLDYVLLPALAIFIGLTIYAIQRKRQADACCTPKFNGVKK